MIKTIEHAENIYPAYQADGNAARFCRAFALEVCQGDGLDIGCNRREWVFPDARGIDVSFDDGFHAMNLPQNKRSKGGKWDYIHSSHMLEHFSGNWADVLDYWISVLKPGGVLFLYLPDWSQSYWRVFSNRRHIHTFEPQMLEEYVNQNDEIEIAFVSGVDAYNSFIVMAQKK